MTKNEIREFSLRIAEGSKTDLVVTTYDIILHYIAEAEAAVAEDNKDDVVFNLQKAKQFVNHLSSCLDFKFSISAELMRLYIYINNCLVKDIIKRNTNHADSIRNVIKGLREAFSQISSQDTSGKAIKNSEQVYVGYTYGKTSTLNEVIVR